MSHDTDRTQLEFGSELSEYGEVPGLASEQYEYGSELGNIMNEVLGGAYGEVYEGGYQELPLPEVMEDELASRLLEIRSDQELDHFLGDLFKKVAGGLGKVIKGPVGQALGGVLKQVAKQALPSLGTAVGGFFGGPVGAALGSQLASTAGSAFGLEYEGLSGEDREFETARRYVRFAGEAAKKAAIAPPNADPTAVAKTALVDAAKTHAPGLLATPDSGASAMSTGMGARAGAAYPGAADCPSCGGGTGYHHRRTGKWIRRGRHIVLLGV
jgi:hypothetical protein